MKIVVRVREVGRGGVWVEHPGALKPVRARWHGPRPRAGEVVEVEEGEAGALRGTGRPLTRGEPQIHRDARGWPLSLWEQVWADGELLAEFPALGNHRVLEEARRAWFASGGELGEGAPVRVYDREDDDWR